MKNETVVLPPLTLESLSRVVKHFSNPVIAYGKRGQAVISERVLFGNSEYVTELCAKVA